MLSRYCRSQPEFTIAEWQLLDQHVGRRLLQLSKWLPKLLADGSDPVQRVQ